MASTITEAGAKQGFYLRAASGGVQREEVTLSEAAGGHEGGSFSGFKMLPQDSTVRLFREKGT